MKSIRYIFAILSFMISGGCNFLELEPQDFVNNNEYYKTEEDLQAALNGIYSELASGSLYKSYFIGRAGLDADQGYQQRDGDAKTLGEYYVVATDIKVLSIWQTLYRGINNANILLENVDKESIDIEDAERQRIKAEALFLRAYFYFLLVQNWGDVPYITVPTEGARPEDVQVARTPALEVYDHIISDMNKALPYVKQIDELGYGGKVTQSAIHGILARVHLYVAGEPYNRTEDYALARDHAWEVISSNKHRLNPDFQQIFINYAQDIYDIGESIWEVEFYGNGTGLYAQLGGYVGGTNGIRNSSEKNNVGYTYDYVNATKFAYDLYKTVNSKTDIRRDLTIAPFKYSTPSGSTVNDAPDKVNWSSTQIFNRNAGKFRREYEILFPKHKSYTPTNFPLLRYADVLLMFAEADNEVNHGPTADAYNAVNQVVRRGFGEDPSVPNADYDWTGMDYESFKSEIRNERARELCFEALRKHDLVRWGIFVEQMKRCLADAQAAPTFNDLNHAIDTYSNASERDVVWPIPSYEMGLNPKLTQNAGW